MSRSLSYILSLFLAISVLLPAKASDSFQFTHINTSNSAISYDGVSKIMQDSRGYIWMGTFKGLNRYDGTRFVTYYKNQLGLDSDFIHTIIEDTEGNLWIGTDAGVTRYMYDSASFEPFNVVSDKGTVVRNKVTFLYCDGGGNIWIIANYQGCFRYDPHSGELVNFKDDITRAQEYDSSGSSISFRRMVCDGNGGMYFSRYHQNLVYSDESLSSITPVRPENDPEFYEGDEIEQLFMKDGRLLVASNLHGVSQYDPLTNTVSQLIPMPQGVNMVDAFLHQQRWIWLCTTKGLWRFDLENEDEPLHLVHSSNDRFSIPGNYVYSVLLDSSDDIWVGTKDGGVGFCGSFQRRINKEYYDAFGTSLSNCVVSGFAYDDEGSVWVATEQSGLLRYDIASGKSYRVNVKGLPTTVCPPVFRDGALWFGSLDGLYRLDTHSLELEYIGVLRRHEQVNDPKIYYGFISSNSGKMYFANTLGLFEYDDRSRTYSCVESMNGVFITSMADAPDGRLWVSSYATGLFLLDPQSGSILENYRFGDGSGLPSDKLASVFVDSSSNVWTIGFNNGFSRLLPDGTFRCYNLSSMPSLRSDVYFSAVQDASGNLWITSDKGLVLFDPVTEQVSIFTELSGMLDDKMTRAVTVLPSTEIFAGSDNGFVHFFPQSLMPEQEPHPVIISKMRVGDKVVGGNVDIIKSFELTYDQNSFGFQFSVPGQMSNFSGRIRCRLEGYDKQWRDITTDKSVYFFNIPSGLYSLRVMSSSNGSVWVENHVPVDILIKPSFFASFTGICLIIIFFVMTMLFVGVIVYQRQKKLHQTESEQFRKRAEEEMFHEKMNFFSHVVHEIKTPLTLIRTPLQSVVGKENMDEDARHDLKVAQNNVDYLTQLVNELLEFVRIERSGYVLNCVDVDIVEMLKSLVFNYNDTARERNIRISFNASQDSVWVYADRPALGKILNNILINALKYASSYIEIFLTTENGMVKIAVANDGDVIPDDMREAVFRPFVQYRVSGKSSNGVGIGLPLAHSLAKMHSGNLELTDDKDKTVFCLTLPVCEAPDVYTTVDAVDGAVETHDVSAHDENRVATLLVVDDNDDLRGFMIRKLSSRYRVLSASDASTAMQILRESNVDLMITDITMPGKDGLQLCKDIRTDVELSHLPIIILSARTSVESKIQAMSYGADLYIEKPFDLDYLRSSVDNIIDRRALMRKAIGSGVQDVDITMFGLPKRDEDFFTRFDTLVSENISNSDLSNEFLAEQLCMSVSTMIRKLHKLLDTSPNNYIRNKRLSVASRMIKDSHGNNITEICYSVGFTNVSYFAKCFKEQYGVTPSEWASK